MKHLFLINPVAGRGDAIRQLLDQIDACFPDGRDCRVVQTEYAGHAEALTAEAAAAGEDVRIYACGGDGTLNEVVNAAAGHPHVAVTHIPLGTGNDFLRIFGKDLPRFRCVAELKDGPQSVFDVMDCNGRLGLDVVCAGVDARVAADVHKYTAGGLFHGTGAYVASLLVNVFLKGMARPLRVEIEGEVWDRDTTILCVCNGRYYGGGFMPVGEAMPDDGVLDVLLVKKVSLLTFIRLAKKYSTGRYAELPHLVRHFRTTTLRASSAEPTTIVIDGEVIREETFTIGLSQKKLNFFYPAGASYAPRPAKT